MKLGKTLPAEVVQTPSLTEEERESRAAVTSCVCTVESGVEQRQRAGPQGLSSGEAAWVPCLPS